MQCLLAGLQVIDRLGLQLRGSVTAGYYGRAYGRSNRTCRTSIVTEWENAPQPGLRSSGELASDA